MVVFLSFSKVIAGTKAWAAAKIAVPVLHDFFQKGSQRYADHRSCGTVADMYDKVKEDLHFRLEKAEKCGIGVELPEFGPSAVPRVPNVPTK